MNILLEFTTLNYLTNHQMVKRLAEIYPGSRFGVILNIAPGGDHVEKFLKGQKDVVYQFFGFRHEIFTAALKGEVDYPLLEAFEETLPEKSLWRLVAADKFLGDGFLHDVVMPESYLAQLSSDEILRVFSGVLISYRRIFYEFNTDLFLPALNQGSIAVYVIRYLCQQRGLPYITPASLRVGNFVAFSPNTILTLPQIDEAYKDLMDGKSQMDLSRAEALYEKIMGELENSQYFDRQHAFHRIVKLKTIAQKLKHLSAIPRSVAVVTRDWFRKRALNQMGDLRGQPYRWSAYWRNVSIAVKMHLQSYKLLQPDFGETLPPGQKYLYYPLQTIPEYSTNFLGTMWMDQVHLIELLAKSVPHDWVVYVKEHPATLPARLRPDGFFERIQRIPNVRLAPLDADYHQLIIHAQMVAVVTGTTGWEAIQRGKPVLTLADNFFDAIGLSSKCTDLEKMASTIRDEWKRSKAISPEDRRRRFIYFLAAIIEHGFEVTHASQFFYEAGTPQQYESAGCESAVALKKYLDYLKSRNMESVVC